MRFFMMDAPDAPVVEQALTAAGYADLGTLGSAARFEEALVTAGYEVVLPDEPAETHASPREPGTEDFDRTIELIVEALHG